MVNGGGADYAPQQALAHPGAPFGSWRGSGRISLLANDAEACDYSFGPASYLQAGFEGWGF
jgi:hypothetical protein